MTRTNRKITIPVSIGYGLTDIMGAVRLPLLAHGCFSFTQPSWAFRRSKQRQL